MPEAPPQFKYIARLGGLLALFVLLGYCATALAGNASWGKALGLGALRAFFIMGLSGTVKEGNPLAWWTLLIVLAFNVWKGVNYTADWTTIATGAGFDDWPSSIFLGILGAGNWIFGGFMILLLLSPEVRKYLHLIKEQKRQI
ncbi:MAG: hypothetical protein V4726_12355 [Verrucomicrobiota bacterium]